MAWLSLWRYRGGYLRGHVFEWGLAFLMEILFLYGLKNRNLNGLTNRNLTFSLSIFMIFLLELLVPLDPIWKGIYIKYILCPLSGALAIFFLYKARSDKEHFVTSFLYFITGLNLCFVFQNKEGAFYFIIYIKFDL